MRPPAVLDHQGALMDYLDSSVYETYLDRFAEDLLAKGKVAKLTGLAALLRVPLGIAQAFHVQADMMPLLRAASMDLESTDYLVHERIPAESGFLMFDDPWVTTDVWGTQMTVAALQWWHGSPEVEGGTVQDRHPGIYLVTYADTYDERDEVTQNLIAKYGEELRTLGRLHVSHLWFLPYRRKVGPLEDAPPEEYMKFANEGQTLAEYAPNSDRMIVALFRLLNQILVDVSDAPLDRATTKRATRKRLPARVQTIKLRRKVRIGGGDHEPGHVDWQHSWVVRGHWAWRKCGDAHPFAEEYDKGFHARVYIAPHYKGPEDKPLLLTEKVWSLAQ